MDKQQVRHAVQNGDHVYTKGLSEEQYEKLGDALVDAGFTGEYPSNQYHKAFDSDWVFGVDTLGENCHSDDYSIDFRDGRALTFEEFMSNLQPSTSPSEPSTVQRITLAHQACLSACNEAVQAYDTYSKAIEDLKTEAGKGFKIEELTWVDFVDVVRGAGPEDDGEW